MLTYGGLFAFISGSSFVLQKIYGLDELSFAFSFTFVVVGFITGTTLAQRLVGRCGLDGTIRLGVTCLALGGVTHAGPRGARACRHRSRISAPMAIYGDRRRPHHAAIHGLGPDAVSRIAPARPRRSSASAR